MIVIVSFNVCFYSTFLEPSGYTLRNNIVLQENNMP